MIHWPIYLASSASHTHQKKSYLWQRKNTSRLIWLTCTFRTSPQTPQTLTLFAGFRDNMTYPGQSVDQIFAYMDATTPHVFAQHGSQKDLKVVKKFQWNIWNLPSGQGQNAPCKANKCQYVAGAGELARPLVWNLKNMTLMMLWFLKIRETLGMFPSTQGQQHHPLKVFQCICTTGYWWNRPKMRAASLWMSVNLVDKASDVVSHKAAHVTEHAAYFRCQRRTWTQRIFVAQPCVHCRICSRIYRNHKTILHHLIKHRTAAQLRGSLYISRDITKILRLWCRCNTTDIPQALNYGAQVERRFHIYEPCLTW